MKAILKLSLHGKKLSGDKTKSCFKPWGFNLFGLLICAAIYSLKKPVCKLLELLSCCLGFHLETLVFLPQGCHFFCQVRLFSGFTGQSGLQEVYFFQEFTHMMGVFDWAVVIMVTDKLLRAGKK
jgi:hypothetical protein